MMDDVIAHRLAWMFPCRSCGGVQSPSAKSTCIFDGNGTTTCVYWL